MSLPEPLLAATFSENIFTLVLVEGRPVMGERLDARDDLTSLDENVPPPPSRYDWGNDVAADPEGRPVRPLDSHARSQVRDAVLRRRLLQARHALPRPDSRPRRAGRARKRRHRVRRRAVASRGDPDGEPGEGEADQTFGHGDGQ